MLRNEASETPRNTAVGPSDVAPVQVGAQAPKEKVRCKQGLALHSRNYECTRLLSALASYFQEKVGVVSDVDEEDEEAANQSQMESSDMIGNSIGVTRKPARS